MAEYHLRTPISEEDVVKLRVGDTVYVSGVVFTARDAAHKKILQLIDRGEPLPMDFRGLALYHAGPVVRKVGDRWEVLACGPTTSTRMEVYEADFIAKTGIRLVIGKGGMKEKTVKAMKEYKAAYAVFPGGAGVLAARAIKRVLDVFFLEELGVPEAVWVFEVENFGPLSVVIDSHGNNFYDGIREEARRRMEDVLARLKLPP